MAISDHQGMLVLPLPRGMEPGQGFDPRTSTALATALTFSGHRRGTEPPTTAPAKAGKTAIDISATGLGQNISFALEEITSSQSLAQAQNVSASADFSYSALGTQGSASLETEFTSENRQSSAEATSSPTTTFPSRSMASPKEIS